MMDFLQQLQVKASKVEEALNSYLPPADTYPTVIHEALRYSITAGGKRLRPVLTLAAAETLGKDPGPVIPAACAIELIHTYSLVHDDLPAMDNDDYRRGKLTSHKIYGEAMAILVGDSLLTLAFELLTRTGTDEGISPDKVLKVISEVAQACGTGGLIGGQVADLVFENKPIKAPDLDYIHSHKTGALYRVAVRSGAILSGASAKEIKDLTEYADNLGLAFQIIDDILDVEGDAEKLGKPIGSDEKNMKATYPSLYGLTAAKEKAREIAMQAEMALEPFGTNARFMRELLHFILSRDS